MLRMYHSQRRRGGCNPHGVSPINIGDIYYLQDGVKPFGDPFRYRSPIRREPWMVVGFTNREYYPCSPFRPHTTYLAGPGNVVVKSLRDGRVKRVGEWFILWHEDHGFTKEWGAAPAIPVLAAYRPVPQQISKERIKRCKRKKPQRRRMAMAS